MDIDILTSLMFFTSKINFPLCFFPLCCFRYWSKDADETCRETEGCSGDEDDQEPFSAQWTH